MENRKYYAVLDGNNNLWVGLKSHKQWVFDDVVEPFPIKDIQTGSLLSSKENINRVVSQKLGGNSPMCTHYASAFTKKAWEYRI